MFNKFFSDESRPGAFFRYVDWSAFWTASIVSMLVYFVTLGPSVTLEDSGELAVAGDYLGVPHPPGYPIWTMCAYVFARLFSWVTYRGQPTPAWSISLMSGVFAALAAGLTAMLITRSGADILRGALGSGADRSEKKHNLIAWVGGVGGSLVFAFSPVMWSQATIVEVYTLNAFFLMWIFLLTYRWMRRPSDKILWLTAFIFGLGLTNYQVLLLAAVPLVIVIFLSNLSLFRDFLLLSIPMILTAHVLQLGAELPAQAGMSGPAYAKHIPDLAASSLKQVIKTIVVPSQELLFSGLALVFVGLILALILHGARHPGNSSAALWWQRLRRARGPFCAGLIVGGALLCFFAASVTSTGLREVYDLPLVAASHYVKLAALALLVLALSVGGASSNAKSLKENQAWFWLIAAGVALLLLLQQAGAVPGAAMPAGYMGLPYDWTLPTLVCLGGLAVLLILSLTIPRGIFYALPVVAVQLGAFILLRKGALNGLTHPTTWWFWWVIAWNFMVLGLAWLILPNGRNVALTAFFAQLGVAFYVYMPIVSDLRNPPMNWGYPRTWEGFKHAITRGQYEKITPTDMLSSKFLKQLGLYCTDLRVQFTLIAASLGFIPFTLWSLKPKTTGVHRWRAGYVASGIYILVAVLIFFSELAQGEVYGRLDKALLALILLFLITGGIAILMRQVESFALKTWRNHNFSESLTAGLVLSGVGMVLLLALGLSFKLAWGMVLTKMPELSALSEAQAAEALATVVAWRWQGLGILAALALVISLVFAIKYAEKRYDFRFDADDISQHWLIATTAGFLMMSVVLVGLANIKGDLQDAFIQKVKFISSHGLFAIWIGYGLAFGLAVGDHLLHELVAREKISARLRAWLWGGIICAGLALAVIPIYENYFNEYLVFSMSGAEQNGHDFGWQFGNYQLRGADAIMEELEDDEEPLPNPAYPPEMEPHAYFFGGTDPGRFVPTYMIYSAQVRPDVFLVTQNALADNTYINTMRDLYGDQVWMPTAEDSAEAFQRYVEEVRSGKRPHNADLQIEGGRVQVSGALGVMEINGILSDMIFQKNKARHAFYIEESYVVPWMFPYLTPHGLIMKINADQTPFDDSSAVTQDDLEFWDWYRRHLLRSKMYRRDLPAQKSFSKLRSALAGLYAARGMLQQSETAFQEARMLYPASPEANFRYVQEVLLRLSRYDDAITVLNGYNQLDPNNGRGFDFIEHIRRYQSTHERIKTLTAKILAKEASPDEVLSLALAYQELGQTERAVGYVKQILEMRGQTLGQRLELAILLSQLGHPADAVPIVDELMPKVGAQLTPEQLMDVVHLYSAARQPDKMLAPLSRYLYLKPDDWSAWLDIAVVYGFKQQAQEFQTALEKGLSLGKGAALQRIQEDPVLRQMAEPFLQRMMRPTSNVPLPGLGPRVNQPR